MNPAFSVIFFTVGVVPGIVATVLYAMVPGVRITALGIKEVPTESLEASRTFGATPRQTDQHAETYEETRFELHCFSIQGGSGSAEVIMRWQT